MEICSRRPCCHRHYSRRIYRDQCFIVNGKKMYGKKPTKTYTKEEWAKYNERKKKEWSDLRKADPAQGEKKTYSNSEEKTRSFNCYECGGLGHFAKDCPSRKEERDQANQMMR